MNKRCSPIGWGGEKWSLCQNLHLVLSELSLYSLENKIKIKVFLRIVEVLSEQPRVQKTSRSAQDLEDWSHHCSSAGYVGFSSGPSGTGFVYANTKTIERSLYRSEGQQFLVLATKQYIGIANWEFFGQDSKGAQMAYRYDNTINKHFTKLHFFLFFISPFDYIDNFLEKVKLAFKVLKDVNFPTHWVPFLSFIQSYKTWRRGLVGPESLHL